MPRTQSISPSVPRDFAGLTKLIMTRHGDLPRRLAQVAKFAIEHPDDIAFGTAASVAGRSHVQPSTLVRLAQALGYSGFSDFQSVFRERLRKQTPSYAERLEAVREHTTAGASTAALLSAFAQAAIRSVEALRDQIDVAKLDAAVHALAQSGTIYLAGQRRSFPVVAYLGYMLAKLGIKHELLASHSGIEAENLAFAGPNDVLLAFSFAPYAPGTLAVVGNALACNVPVVAITDGPFSPLVPGATVWLEVVEADVDGFRNPAATFALAITLAVAVAEQRATLKKVPSRSRLSPLK